MTTKSKVFKCNKCQRNLIINDKVNDNDLVAGSLGYECPKHGHDFIGGHMNVSKNVMENLIIFFLKNREYDMRMDFKLDYVCMSLITKKGNIKCYQVESELYYG